MTKKENIKRYLVDTSPDKVMNKEGYEVLMDVDDYKVIRYSSPVDGRTLYINLKLYPSGENTCWAGFITDVFMTGKDLDWWIEHIDKLKRDDWYKEVFCWRTAKHWK